jgi:valyl-tRNA synthetase
MTIELSKTYDPRLVEARWYQNWLDGGWFRADETSDKPPFVIVIPPPNVTGSLHMGHALYTLQDIMIRHRRMNGFEALWLPGTDHAGIATQTVVEKQLRAQGISRHDLGRDAFIERVWEWKEKSGGRISLQLRRLGMSLDWSRERFTMDEGLSRAVREAFVTLFEQGLIYQDDRLVNWDPVTQTVLSDLEVEAEEEDGFLWHIAYPVAGSDQRLVVATTRPETLLGDTAVAIHPDDPRYASLHGRMVDLPLCDRQIPIVCDPIAVDMAFGSGAVKITPGHDFNDFETGRRNGLPSICVLDLQARINGNAPERFVGLDRYEARRKVLEELREAGLLVREEPYRFMPGRSQRSGAIVEPLSVGKQWYVKMTPLAEPALAAVADGRIRFVPGTWEKTYNIWLEGIRDWCISRQLWWGHRIPAWTCRDCGTMSVLRHDPTTCPSCGSHNLSQDEDVLDTWFSSALWPFSTLGWPDRTPDLQKFYPTQVMETGFDIIFFWVARMIMMGMHLMDGQVPFDTVYLHAMVRDKNNQKMSKTRGNVIDPLHLVDGVKPEDIPEEERATYAMLLQDFPDGLEPQGADALRFTLATYAAAGRDIKLDVRRVEGYRAFMNKLWNASRFALMNLSDWQPAPLASVDNLSLADRWLLTRLAETVTAASSALDELRISDAAQVLYEFVWHKLCDWYLELIKPTMYGSDAAGRHAAQTVLAHALDTVLRMLHPFIPHITEELWSAIPRATQNPDEPVLCVARWPKRDETMVFGADAAAMDAVITVISGIRRVRGESNIPPSRPLPLVLIQTADNATATMLQGAAGWICTLARCERVELLGDSSERPAPAATTVEGSIELIIPLEGLIDLESERARMEKELAQLDVDAAHFEKKLGNPRFVEKAPPEVLAKDRARLEEVNDARRKVQEALARLT